MRCLPSNVTTSCVVVVVAKPWSLVSLEYFPSMLEPVRPGAVSPDRALCLPTFRHFLIVNKTSLSLLSRLVSLSQLYKGMGEGHAHCKRTHSTVREHIPV